MKKTLDKIRGRSPVDLARESVVRTRRRARRAISRASDRRGDTYITDQELSRAVKPLSLADAIESVRTRSVRRLTGGLSDIDETSRAVKRLFPDSVAGARRAADRICEHQIMIFGRTCELGAPIDWHRDPDSRYSYPLAHFSRITVQPGGGVDPRRVWELNRLHHLVELGRAYALTRDEHYAEEFTVQIANWYDQNPPRFGINWAVAMEAGIRAVNIIAALELFRSSTAVSDRVIAMILKLLLSHGRFIRSNLERSRFGSSNHYLGDLIGLLAIGAAVPELEPGRRWLKFAAKEIRREINDQVLSDGVDYEGSVAYHRLVVEMFSLALMLCEGAGLPRDPQYRRRLRAMLEFTRSYLKPDGTAPAIGDSDDGRVLKFTEKDPLDHRYLLPLGAILLEDRQLLNASAFEEETIWWLGAKAGESFPREPGPKVVHLQAIQAGTVESAAFAEAQIFIQRSGDLYAIVDCGDHGLKGNGSHAHSDALSFELYAYGSTFLRDPGTYVYSASARRRNLFRSTPYHNTVRVDGLDISPIPPDQMFALGRNVKPKINNWSSTRERDVLDAEHHGYTGLGSPVVHRRIVSFEKIPGYWRVRDLFTGEGEHLFEFFFNFDAGMRASLEADGRAVVRGPNASLVIIPLIPVAFESRLVTRWISPAYGTRLRSSGIIYSLRAPVTLETAMLLVPAREEDQSKPARVLEHATKAPGDH